MISRKCHCDDRVRKPLNVFQKASEVFRSSPILSDLFRDTTKFTGLEKLFGGNASFRLSTLNEIIILKTVVYTFSLSSERKITRHRSPGVSRIQTLGWVDPVWTSTEPRFRLGFVPTSGLDTPISPVNDDGLLMSSSMMLIIICQMQYVINVLYW